MVKMICSPSTYVQGDIILKELDSYIKKINGTSSYLIIDSFIYNNYQDYILESLKQNKSNFKAVKFGGECCDEEIEKHIKESKTANVIIGIGGGKTLDTAKAVAEKAKLKQNVVIIPTAASSDAPCSRLSVVYKPNGEFAYYLPLTKNPDMVLMDTSIIKKAPARLLAAGIGDALATYYEAEASRLSNAKTITGGNQTLAAACLAKLCRDTLLKEGYKAYLSVKNQESSKALENIIEVNTYLSGIGFESGGLAAAHAIHNGLTYLEETHEKLHGEKVAFGTLVQMVLENRDEKEIEEIVHFLRKLQLPTTLEELGVKIDSKLNERLYEVAKLSCAEGETIYNLPFAVKPEDVLAAIKLTDTLAKSIR